MLLAKPITLKRRRLALTSLAMAYDSGPTVSLYVPNQIRSKAHYGHLPLLDFAKSRKPTTSMIEIMTDGPVRIMLRRPNLAMKNQEQRAPTKAIEDVPNDNLKAFSVARPA